ncbi:MAG: ASPIC/UnbV domain-containing protein [Pyrinomonadaceae bacterium]
MRSVEVRWLGGKTQTLTNLTIDRYHVIPER